MDNHEFTEIIQALEKRYAETKSAIEQTELTRLMSYYYRLVERRYPQKNLIELTFQSKMNYDGRNSIS